MSFFDKLSKAVNAVKKLQDALSEMEKTESVRQSQSTPAVQRQQRSAASSQKTDFDRLLAEKFSEYEVRRNQTVSQIVPDFSSDVWYCSCGGRNEQLFCGNCGKKQPPRVTRNGYANIPYVLYQDGQPKLAILLINSSPRGLHLKLSN